jgi:hypothetical protein
LVTKPWLKVVFRFLSIRYIIGFVAAFRHSREELYIERHAMLDFLVALVFLVIVVAPAAFVARSGAGVTKQ